MRVNKDFFRAFTLYSLILKIINNYCFIAGIFNGDVKNVEKLKTHWNDTGYPPSINYHYECPEHSQKNKLGIYVVTHY